MQLLHQHRSRMDVFDALGNTPLHLACEEGHGPTALYLIEQANCDADKRNKEERTCWDMCDRQFKQWLTRAVGTDV